MSNHAVTPLDLTPANANSGEAYGFEVASRWEATKNWDISFNYTYLEMYLNVVNATNVTTSGKSPRQQFNLTSHYQFPHNIEMTNLLYTVSELPAINVPSYARFDTVLSWKPKDSLELSLVGQNLFDNRQPEFSSFFYMEREQISRAVYGKVRIWF